jgi:regulator of replication initiation timing
MKSLREKLDKVESEIGHERIAAKGMKEEINGYKIENDTLRTENFELREKIDLLEKEYQKLQDISKGTQFHDDDTIPTDVSLKPGMSVVKASQMKAEDAVREEMEFVRSLPLYQKQHQRIENENLKQNFDNLDKTQSSSSAKEEKYSSGNDVYTAHLTRLLRLAEEAIHRN